MVDSTPTTGSGGSLSGNLEKNISFMQKFYGLVKSTSTEVDRLTKAFGSIGGGSSGNNITTSGTFSFQSQATGTAGFSSGGGSSGIMGKIGNLGLGILSSAVNAAPGVQDVLSTQLLLSQARFGGLQNAAGVVRSSMGAGTTASPFDALQAMSYGAQNGIATGLPGYASNIMPGVAQLSNLTGSMMGGMQAATALNSAQSVNNLRMIGINVRGANGAMSNPGDIMKQLYNFASQYAGHPLTQQEVAISLQSGNGLNRLISNASGGDATLTQAMTTGFQQFSKGGDLSKASLTATQYLTPATNAQSAMNASQFGLNNAAGPSMSKGFVEAASMLTKINDKLAHLVSSNSAAAGALKQLAKGETLLNSGPGKAAGGILGSIGGFISSLGGLRALGRVAPRLLSGFVAGEAVDPLGGGLIADAALIGGGALLSTGGSGLGQNATVTASSSSNGVNSVPAGSAAASIAASVIGTPYSWGGGSIQGATRGTSQGSNTVGFDCSSLVRYVMAKLGVMLPRTSQDQQKFGTQIDPKQAKPGDLVFWGMPAHHVAIYIGNGMIIQAPHTGGHVERVAVDLNSVTSACRVINGSTGTTALNNVLSVPGSSGLNGGTSLNNVINSLFASNPTVGSISDTMGLSPEAAMSGGTTSGSGMGLGSNSPVYGQSSNGVTSIGSYTFVNPKTGTLDVANTSSQAVTNYGGVTVNVNVPGANISAQDVAKAVKSELKSLNIKTGVATK